MSNNTNQNPSNQEPSPSPGGSTSNVQRRQGTAGAEQSNLQELSQSVLHTPTLMSNFQKKRGFLDVNRFLNQPMFDPERAKQLQLANDKPSSTGMMNNQGQQLLQGGAGAAEMSSHTQVLWGTNINTSDVQMKLKNFINNFEEIKDDDDDDEDDQQYQKAPYYIQKLKEVRELDGNVLDIDCDHVFQFDQMLYRQIEDYPADIIPIFDLVVTQVFKELDMYNIGGQNDQDADYNMNNDEFGNDQIIQVRPHNLRKVFRIRELGPNHIEKLVSLRGIIIRNSDIVPEMKEAHFTCTKCFREEERSVQMGRILEPTFCVNCEQRDTFQPNFNASIFSDKQHVKVQETPESVPEGETPQTIHLCAYEDLVDHVRPGDRVEITGIYKAMGVRVNSNKRTLKNVYRTYIDVITYVTADKKRYEIGEQGLNENGGNKADNIVMKDEVDANGNAAQEEMQHEEPAANGLVAEMGLEEDSVKFSVQEIAEFQAFSQKSDVQDILVDSLAPSIWECNDVKKGILCQLFGGVSKEFSQSGRGRFRGEINVLLCGDPSTAKSQLLQYVHKIAPRGIYTSGKGSSAVGLTVYITRDPETKELVLESGALVLSDRGICCIDEFDKMDDNTRVILHEAMEQQTVSVAKAGIICTLNARTAILAAANPIHSKYEPKLSVVENIQLPPTLLSRFDLIYLILDKQTEASDRRLANHIVSLYSTPADENMANEANDDNVQATNLIATNKTSRAFLAKYISYARRFIQPTIPDEMVTVLIQEYQSMRSMGNSAKTITATPRQLESLIRIAESLAKMRLSNRVEQKDIEEGVRLIRTAMQQSATDPKTGEIDMDIITTGVSFASNARIKHICDYIKRVQEDFRDKVAQSGVKYMNLYDYLIAKAAAGLIGDQKEIKEAEFRDALMQLEEENVISLVGHKRMPTIRFMSDQ